MSDSQTATYERLINKFEADIVLVIDSEKNTDSVRLRESGQLRIILRKLITEITNIAFLQLDGSYQVKLYTYICEYLKNAEEYSLAIECYEKSIIICDKIDDIIERTVNKVQLIHGLSQSTYNEITGLKQFAIAPMAVSKILKCLQLLRTSLDILFEMAIRKQEEYSWLILNSCKLIYSMGQPLVWYNCGKYVSEITFFAALCMESVINLSTVRHLKFRMKLYSSIFYSSLSHGITDEAKTILDRAIKEVKMLREKEELDPPIPIRIEAPIINAEVDLAVMRVVLSFWMEPGSFIISDTFLSKFEFPSRELIEKAEKLVFKKSFYISRSIQDRCICECARVQQLTSGNTNEVWRRRSSSLLKAFWTLFENIGPESYFYAVKEESEETDDIETNISKPPLCPIITINGLVEITTIAMFDSTEGVPIKDLLGKIWLIVDASPTPLTDFFEGEKDLSLLRKLAKLIDSSTDEDKLNASLDVVQSINITLHNEHGPRRITLNRRVAVGVWSKYIYPTLQKILSEIEGPETLGGMSQLCPTLMIITRVLDITFIEDSILYGSIAILTAIIMNFLNENRASIALLRQAIDTIDEHRACRVDIQLHMPEDSRDIFSIQRLSFSTKSEAQDWYHSMKRLGAHAFAGFGIFGAGSSADRSDQAIAELHADMLSLLFRYEISYSLRQSMTKKIKNKSFGKTIRENETQKDTINGTIAETGASNFLKDASVIIQQLKSYCSKNNYAKCILYLELARLETSEESILNLLKDAKSCIEECEASEEMLKNGFENLSVISESKQKPPIILARTHRYVYMAPVHCRTLKKATYYRPLAKEQGSGTNISLSSNGLGGCEQKVMVSNMLTPTSCAVKISPLRTGETYVFGYAAFSDDEKVVGGVSPTSLPVQALNPLPTVLLWAYLARTADTLNITSARRFASSKVCDSFFLNPPEPEPKSIGKGENLFISKEPILCMLAVQQASPVLLFEMVRSFILLEAKWAVRVPQKLLHWNLRKESQVDLITSLRRTSVISCVAAYIGSHELTVQIVTMGYNIALNLLEFDDLHISYLVQNSLITFLAALQATPKRNWLELEYKLYSRLYNHIIKLSLLTRNVQPVVNLVSSLLPEILDNDEWPKLTIQNDTELEFSSVLSIAGLCNGIARTDESINQIKSLLAMQMTPENTREFFWKLSSAKRTYSLKGKAANLVNIDETPAPDLLPFDLIMKDKPMTMSAYLSTLVDLAKDLVSNGQSTNLSKLLSRYPVYEEYLALSTKEQVQMYNLIFVRKLPTAEELAALAAAAAPAKGKAPPAAAPPVVDTVESEEDKFKIYEEVSPEEVSEQLFALAKLASIMASFGCPVIGTKNYFPESLGGPLYVVDPYNSSSMIDISSNQILEDTPSDPISPRAKLSNLSRSDFINLNISAIALFTSANSPASAVNVVLRVWNFLIDEWIDPQSFAIEFQDLKTKVCNSCFSLIDMFESTVGIRGEEDLIAGFGETFGMSIEGTLDQSLDQSNLNQNNEKIAVKVESKFDLSVREINEKLYGCRDFFIFMIEVFWLHKEYAHVVAMGSRILTVFMEMSPEFSKRIGDICLPLMIHAQEQLINGSTNKMNELQAALDKFVYDFQEYLKKKNRKKLRIARVEKDPEELAFDAEKAIYQSKVDDAELELRNSKNRLAVLNLQQKKFKTLYSTGVQLLDKVREARINFLLECELEIKKSNKSIQEKKDQSNDFRGCLTSREMEDKCESVLDQYAQVGHFLREKKDKISLIQCLKEQADLLLLFGRVDEARGLWHDAIDGLFNTMDACKDWKSVTEIATASLDSTMLSTFLPASVILGKLSKYCSTSDLDAKAGYCRMAAELIRCLFYESIGHPVTAIGFAAYICQDLCGYAPFGVDSDKLAPLGLTNSLEEILTVLIADGHRIIALPVVVLLEHYHGYYTRNPSRWLSARLVRIRILIDQHLYAEAASMLAGIKYSIITIADGTYTEPVKSKNAIIDVATFDTATSDLNFYSYSPFYNNLPPNDDKNKQALTWIASFPNDFKDFSASYSMKLPSLKLTPEEQAAEEARIAAEAAKAVEEAKKNKGKKVEEAPKVENTNKAPLFDSFQQVNVMTECAHFLVSISSIDSKVSNQAKDILKSYGDQGDDIISKSIEVLGSTGKFLSDSVWIDLYGQLMLLRIFYYIARRKLKNARTVAMSLIQILRNESIALNTTSRIKSTATQIWFKVKYFLLDIAEKQSRSNDAMTIANAASKEASLIMAGYWLRTFLLRRALLHFKLGNLDDCEVDCDSTIKLYEANICSDLGLVRCLSLKASVCRERSLNQSRAKAVQALADGIKFARKARELAELLSNQSGFIGPDSNVTYDHQNSAVIKHELLPSHLFNITHIHNNIPDVTIKPKVDPKVLSLVSGEITIVSKKTKIESNDDDMKTGIDLQGLRLGPTDTSDNYSQSLFVNIYLEEVRSLVVADAAMCILLDEARCSGAAVSYNGDASDVDPCFIDENEVIKEEILVGESALKTLRHCVYAPSYARISLLLNVGKTRVISSKNNPDIFFSALRAALQASFDSAHPWEMMKSTCLQLIEVYGDNSIELDVESRLLKAVVYLISAIKISKQYRYLLNNSITLGVDNAFAANVPDEITNLLLAFTSSSASKSLEQSIPAAVDPKAKGKTPATAASTETGPNGRDALEMLISFLRESDNLWLDSYERDMAIDMHSLLKKTYAPYGSSCSLSLIPDPDSNPLVQSGSVNTLYTLVKTPADFVHPSAVMLEVGLYSHVTAYYLLGSKATEVAITDPAAKGKGAPPTAAAPVGTADPVLTKIAIYRPDLVTIEKSLRDARDGLLDGLSKKVSDIVSKIGNDLCPLLISLVGLLKNGLILEGAGTKKDSLNDDDEIEKFVDRCPETTASVSEENGKTIIAMNIGGITCKLFVEEGTLARLADVVTFDKDCDSIIDNSILSFMRIVLGYPDE